jgi:4-aminobutyrate aminotransferase-like enzyme
MAAIADMSLERRHRLMGAGAELFYHPPLHIVRGSGVWLYDNAGRAFLDVYNNVPHVGHAHPAVAAAIAGQTAMLATNTRYLHGAVLDYAEALTARLPHHLNACLFVNSGSEANDVAWRIAKLVTGHTGALIVEHAYHGITDAMAALTPGHGEPLQPWVAALAAPPPGLRADQGLDAAALAVVQSDTDRALHTLRERGHEPAALFLDSAFTSSGILDPPPAWIAAVAGRVRAAGGLVVGDEVQYGLGRSGSHFWGFERRGFLPDIVTLGKPVGNGYPMGVVVADRPMIEALQSSFGFFSTFGGNAVAAAAGLAVLAVLARESLMDNARETGRYLKERLESLAARHPDLGAVRGVGLLLGVEVRGADSAAATRLARHFADELAAQHGVLIGAQEPGVLKLRPPMPFGREHADRLIDALGAVAGAPPPEG